MQASPKILIVDDYPANLLALEAVLGTKDYDVVRATSGVEALKLVESHDFAAILLDVQMPEMDGYETARRIKALPRSKETPIIFVTAVYKEDEDVRRGYESGGLDYLAKPLIPAVLKTKVRIYADLYRRSQELRENTTVITQVRESLVAERKLEAVLDGISDGVIITDENGTISHINKQARAMIAGKPPPDAVRTEELAACWANNEQRTAPDEWAPTRALRTGAISTNAMLNIRCLDGTERSLASSALPIKDERGVVGVVCIIKTILQ